MKKPLATSLAIGAGLLVSACGSGGDATDQQVGAAVTSEAPDPNNPFAVAETQMNERTMAAVGTDVGDSWVRKMIEHHQGAIEMSRIVLQQNPPAAIAQMAQDTIDKQSEEVEDLRKLVAGGTPDPGSAEVFRASMASMQQAMMSATGADVGETFMRKMLAHHRGGVAMSEAALDAGASGAVRTNAVKTRDGQQREADMTEAMLRGEPMPAAGTPAAVTPAASPEPAPSARPSATTRPRAQAPATGTPAEAAGPHAGHTMTGQ